uniref:t-SNARE coiled-coil homology domain-containing protein n=1 Tax=Strigamia maritima TaxID=126957 RepID=T1JBB9_STRMM
MATSQITPITFNARVNLLQVWALNGWHIARYRSAKQKMASWSRQDEMLDNENQLQADHLAGKVSRLKNLAFDIETETKEHNFLLNNVDSDFDGSTGLLSGSSSRIHKMLNRGQSNRKVMCYVSGGLVLIFCICYYLVFVRTQR